MASSSIMQTRIKISGALVLAGLLIEVLSLYWALPAAFLLFAILGVPMVLAGILLFLHSLVSVKTRGDGLNTGGIQIGPNGSIQKVRIPATPPNC